jgi:hypothetical protein
MSLPYDILEEEATRGLHTIADVYSLILGEAMKGEDLCGVICSGSVNLSHSQGGTWGHNPIRFSGHEERWYVRCAPRGRMGKPLLAGEVRQVAILLRMGETSKNATVTTIKLWRRPTGETLRARMANKDTRMEQRGTYTYGPMGLAFHGINLFEKRAPVLTAVHPFAAITGTHAVLPAVATISAGSPEGPVCRIECSVTPTYIVAGALVGVYMEERHAPRSCREKHTHETWSLLCNHIAHSFDRACRAARIEDGKIHSGLLFTAEDVFEQASFTGYLDQRADAFYKGAFPDDAHKPSGLPLMLAIAVCVACAPERWGMAPTQNDDAFATREATLFLESTIPSVIALGPDGVSGEQLHSLDIVIKLGVKEVRELIDRLKSGRYEGKSRGVNHQWAEKAMHDTLHYLLCTGTAVCADLFGLRPNEGEDDLYTPFGLASTVVDPVTASREQSAHEKGLGNTVQRWPTLRTSTKGRRQLALAAVFVEVDTWLRTGKYRNVVLDPTTQAQVSVNLEDLDPTAAPPAQAPTVAAATAAKSAKKKKRPEALLAERGKMRGAKQSHCAHALIRSIFENGSCNDRYLAAASEQLCVKAIVAATGIFADVLQQGACTGMADLFKFQTHLVTPSSKVQCAHCDNAVNAVESIAFSGAFGSCAFCGHPRCLKCVSEDIDTSSHKCTNANLQKFLACNFCDGPTAETHPQTPFPAKIPRSSPPC